MVPETLEELPQGGDEPQPGKIEQVDVSVHELLVLQLPEILSESPFIQAVVLGQQELDHLALLDDAVLNEVLDSLGRLLGKQSQSVLQDVLVLLHPLELRRVVHRAGLFQTHHAHRVRERFLLLVVVWR